VLGKELGHPSPDAFVAGFRAIALASVILALVSVLCTWIWIGRKS
jgi:hypothetical protein